MVFFRSKAKGQPELLSTDQHGDYSAPPNPSNNDLNYSGNNFASAPPSQFNNDPAYANSYTHSNVSSNMSNADTRVSQPPPRTTIVTTTTTTTTTTTVDSDGSTHTQVHPYDPSTDPPPASETTITNATQPSGNQNLNDNPEYTAVRRNSTSGGRPIPPRSELRNSQINPLQVQTQPQPQPQYQPQPSPLSSHPPVPVPHSSNHLSSNESSNGAYYNQTPNATYPSQASDHGSHQSSMYPSQTSSSIYSNPTSDHTSHYGKRETLMTGMKAIHGAGEALRGTVNSKIAGKLGDETDAMNQRMIKEQGLREVRETGLRDRVHGGKLRKRSLSRGLGEDRRGLERVDENGVNF